MSETKPEADYEGRLEAVYHNAKQYFSGPAREEDKRHFLPGKIASEYFTLLGDYYRADDPDKADRMKLYAEYCILKTRPLDNRERWKELMAKIEGHESDPQMRKEYSDLREGLTRSARYGEASIQGCPIAI